MDCTYCGSDVDRHDPVFVSESRDADRSDPFCNYACLSAHIDEENLVAGAACEW